MNSSREPVAALRDMIHGTRRRPTSIMMAINATTFPDGDAHIQRQRGKAEGVFFHHSGDGRGAGPSVSTITQDLQQSASRLRFVRAGCLSTALFKRAQQHHGTGG